MFLLIPKYRTSPMEICKTLNISELKLEEILSTLENCHVIENQSGKIKILRQSMHLSQQSFMSKTNATMFRLMAIEHQQKSASNRDYFFTATVAADRETQNTIKRKWLKLLNEISQLVDEAPSKEIFHLNFDLFSIS
jgi:DNA-binding transcriptional regulator YiaG